MEFIYDKIAEILYTGQQTVLCTVVLTKGSTPLKAGAKMIVWENGKIFGTIGGGILEKTTIENAIEVLKGKKPKLFKHELLKQHNMCCGGYMEIFIEPIMQKKKLLLFGAGHVGKAIAKYAHDLDFELVIIDNREKIFEDWTIDGYNKTIGPYNEVLPSLSFDDSTFIVIVTAEHDTDREILSYCIKKPHAYLGMIGSRNKIETTIKRFIASGVATKSELEKIFMPIGVEINASTSEEIAISIVAQLIKEKNKK